MSIENKIVLITGVTLGIGNKTALGLAKLGVIIVFTTRDDVKEEKNKS